VCNHRDVVLVHRRLWDLAEAFGKVAASSIRPEHHFWILLMIVAQKSITVFDLILL
jgi:hypothetical protein